MAKILKQGFKPIEGNALPSLKELQVGTPYAKRLGALPSYLYSQLPMFAQEHGYSINSDGFGWSYPTDGDKRISMVVGIICGENICTYNRVDKDIGMEQNSNIGLDLIGSKGFGVNSLYDKVPAIAWNCRIKSAEFCDYMAYEETDGEGDSIWIEMPIIIVELENNPLEMVDYSSLKGEKTSKMQALIKHIEDCHRKK